MTSADLAQPPTSRGQSSGVGSGAGGGAAIREARRRRTFAIISHPDAGKSTMTEALALHAEVITEAGAVHGKSGRRATVSDWMDMEKARGISITSAALQFAYGDHVVNLVDTPGHSDFSEDTYRVLSAVDAAVMLIDAAKGLEPQTLKLFGVCKARGIPVVTVINKWDRPGLEALELMDEIYARIGLQPTPLTWPVGIAGDFHGVLDRRSGDYIAYTRTAGGATRAPEERMAPDAALDAAGVDWTAAVEESEMLGADGLDHDQELFLDGLTTPVLFASAISNFGVGALLETLVELAPSAVPFGYGAPDADGRFADHRDVGSPFSAFVFKVQAGMNKAHRDQVAFARVTSGVFERGSVVTHAQTGRPFATKYAQSIFGRETTVIDTAYPGDIIGLVNASALRPGDTIYLQEPVEFPPIATFAPEHFAVASSADSSKFKQFRKGIEQLDSEGVVQVLRSELRGNQLPVLAAVGPMQFEVVQERMQSEFNVTIRLEVLSYSQARITDVESLPALAGIAQVEVLQRTDGTLMALFPDRWRVTATQRNHPDITLQPLLAGDT